MSDTKNNRLTRRGLILTGAAAGLALNSKMAMAAEEGDVASPSVRRNISAFRAEQWQDHFDSLKNGAILADTNSRMVQFWSEDQSVYKLYPSSVPLTDQLTRRGYTSVIRKVKGPSWAPTPNMKKRNPEWPDFVGPGPDNPLGTHALYLSWQYYRVHGTNDTRKIGRRSSNGCIGLYNDQIAELFGLAKVGTQVKLI
jgi:lipoprotein-anchoring transpeptidase ErfK/SrfK